jgi:hypothetical protein
LAAHPNLRACSLLLLTLELHAFQRVMLNQQQQDCRLLLLLLPVQLQMKCGEQHLPSQARQVPN